MEGAVRPKATTDGRSRLLAVLDPVPAGPGLPVGSHVAGEPLSGDARRPRHHDIGDALPMKDTA